MSQDSRDNSFTLAWSDIDLALLPADSRQPGSAAFRRAVGEYLAGQLRGVGAASIVFDDAARTMKVSWPAGKQDHGSDHAGPEELEAAALRAIAREDFAAAVPLLKLHIQQRSDDPVARFHLGMIYSDQGRLSEATAMLEDSLRLRPDHVPALVALGVVHAKAGEVDQAIAVLRRAANHEPGNPLVHQNLGGCLLNQGRVDEALIHLRECLKLDPGNVQAKLGLAQTIETRGELSQADGLYQEVLAVDASPAVHSLAKEGRTRISHANLRKGGTERPDVVMYCVGALERFDDMTPQEIRTLGQEIAVLGMKGLDINDPARKYRLQSLPGEFSGLHLVSLMYAAFQEIAPGTDVGIDLSGEYTAAKKLHRPRRKRT